MPALPRAAGAPQAARMRRAGHKRAVVRQGADGTRAAALRAASRRAALRTEAPAVASRRAVRRQGVFRAAAPAVPPAARRWVAPRAVARRRRTRPAAAHRAVVLRAAEAAPSTRRFPTQTLRRTEALRAARARWASTAISRVSFAVRAAGVRPRARVAAARRLTTATGASVTRNAPRGVCARRAAASRLARAHLIARAVSFVAAIAVPTRRAITNIALRAASNARAATIAPP